MQEKIKAYYKSYDEDGRLFRDNVHLTEYLTTIRYFERVLVPGSQILDACAGTGRYSLWLADQGHKVTACDLVEHNLEIIKTKTGAENLAAIFPCDVLNLSGFEDNGFDAVLCMGALYHFRDRADKHQAISECVRVCKPGGIVVLTYITRVAPVLAELNQDISNIGGLVTWLDHAGEDDVFAPTAPDVIEALALECRLEKMYNIGVDGMAYLIHDKLNNADEENFQKYLDFHYSTCESQDMIGASMHGLWIGRKGL